MDSSSRTEPLAPRRPVRTSTGCVGLKGSPQDLVASRAAMGGNVCPGRAITGVALKFKVYPGSGLVRSPANARLSPSRAPCIGPPSNLVRSEEAAIRWGGECRGKPGPFVPGLPIRSGCGCALPLRNGTGLPAQRGPRSRGSPGAPSATRLGGHVVSPAPLCPGLPSAQAAAAPCLRRTARAYPPSGGPAPGAPPEPLPRPAWAAT